MDIGKEKKIETLLDVNSLAIRFKSQGNIVYAVNNLSFKVYSNEILGIIGESGCGKTSAILGKWP